MNRIEEKWISQGFSPAIYERHQDFCSFMEKSGLMSQMKITRDRPKEIEGEPAIIVEGNWMKWSTLRERFKITYSKTYREKFIVNSSYDVYTYLDNGKGLQKHHPFLSDHNPISQLSESDYEQVHAKSLEFIRPGEEHLSTAERAQMNQGRTFVIQIVSSYTKGLNTNFHEWIKNRKHPYLRLIIGKDNRESHTKRGEVYEVGYGWKSPLKLPFVASQGQFRSPDLWEYQPCEERVVTNIPVSQEEARAFAAYSLKYHNQAKNIGEEIGFHLLEQNCSTFIRKSLKAANIKVPTEIGVASLIKRIAPNWIRSIGENWAIMQKKVSQAFAFTISILPQGVKSALAWTANKIERLIKRVIEGYVAFTFVPAKVALGDVFGRGGLEFAEPGDKPTNIKNGLSKPTHWFSISKQKFNLPGILQEWQRKQASTVVYHRPLRLTIVPPAENC